MPPNVTTPESKLYETLEARLAATDEPFLQHRFLNQLIAEYVYVNPSRARVLLTQQQLLYESGASDEPDYFYYLHLGNLENQEYADQKARKLLARAVERVDRHGDITDRVEVYLDYLGILINLEETAAAREYHDKALRLLTSFPNPRLKARVLCRQGYFYLNQHSHPKAIRKFLEANKLLAGYVFELNAKDHYFYTLVHAGLGTLYTRPDGRDRAATAFREAIERCEAIGLSARLPWHRLNLGKVLMEANNFTEAMDNFRSIIDSRANGSKAAYAAACVNLSICYFSTQQPAGKIRELLDEAERIFTQGDSPRRSDLVSIVLARGQLFINEGDIVGAINVLQDCLVSIEKDDYRDNLKLTGLAAETCQLLASCYAKLSEFKYAYRYQHEADFYLDRHYELQDAENQERFAAQFEAEVREQERESLQLKASQLQLQALRAQMNPHFLYNALNSIQSFITTNDASTASKYLAKFAMLMRRSLEYTNREYITLEDEQQFLKDYLDINCHLRFAGQLSYTVCVDTDLEEDIIGVPTMILQPYVENAIEHGLRTRPKGHIEVVFTPIKGDDDNILAVVTDDGIGRACVAEMQANDPTREYHQSRGTSITQSRLELLTDDPDNRVLIEDLYSDDGTAAGTRVTVRIPITDVLLRRVR